MAGLHVTDSKGKSGEAYPASDLRVIRPLQQAGGVAEGERKGGDRVARRTSGSRR